MTLDQGADDTVGTEEVANKTQTPVSDTKGEETPEQGKVYSAKELNELVDKRVAPYMSEKDKLEAELNELKRERMTETEKLAYEKEQLKAELETTKQQAQMQEVLRRRSEVVAKYPVAAKLQNYIWPDPNAADMNASMEAQAQEIESAAKAALDAGATPQEVATEVKTVIDVDNPSLTTDRGLSLSDLQSMSADELRKILPRKVD